MVKVEALSLITLPYCVGDLVSSTLTGAAPPLGFGFEIEPYTLNP